MLMIFANTNQKPQNAATREFDLSRARRLMNEDRHKARSCPHIAIAAIASAVPEHRIDQQSTRDIVLSIAPELRSHESLFLNTGITVRRATHAYPRVALRAA